MLQNIISVYNPVMSL